MTRIVNVHEAKTHLSELLRLVEAGEEIVIARAGKPVARLGPVSGRRESIIGALEGRISISDDFDEPMPAEWLNAFYEVEIAPSLSRRESA